MFLETVTDINICSTIFNFFTMKYKPINSENNHHNIKLVYCRRDNIRPDIFLDFGSGKLKTAL